jgi:DNA-binding NarL/FixJ family response regulator
MDTIRVLLVDDALDFLAALKERLSTEAGWEIVAEARDGPEAIALAGEHHPDIVLMDIFMPGLNGVEATRRIVEALPHVKVIMLTASDQDESLLAAAQAGAHGYIVKGADKAEIVRVVQAAQQGEWLWGASIARKVLNLLIQKQGPPANKPPLPGLTAREMDALKLIAQGYNNDEIAARMFISPHTVRNHITSIFGKLQVRDRAQAIIRARDAGL